MAGTLEREDHQRDADFNKILHGKSAEAKGGIAAMFSKDPEAKRVAMEQYFKHFDGKKADDETAVDRESRKAEYASLTRHYYNLASDLYEYGWGQSFHFCRFSLAEPFSKAIARHEHFLAYHMGIKKDMKVLDVGCGVGGPAREISNFTGAHITGINNNDYQIDRAIHYATKEKLSGQLKFIKGDFMQMPFPDNTFDAVYAIEAAVHAPRLEGVYGEMFRVLKPGGICGVYEWLMTDDYNNDDVGHRRIRLDIELGSGVSNMVNISEAIMAMKSVGFELLHHEDLAARPDDLPWYWPIAGELKYVQSVSDILVCVRMTHWGRSIMHHLTGLLEFVGFAPAGTKKTADALATAADGLVAGGKRNLFTPMYLMVGKKPAY
ncbi:sterol 24-C-methyltransferase [Colletotrichum tofieldiae]|uniref:Sterol 24-C-methyltransferase n=1 Tax=Colletotrichum tofieldiae TaxID=708197 RepID=A0A166SC26_9PEZI|nr:sterol 24-C-methyltransferase [Colletotrichum tofieldiae]